MIQSTFILSTDDLIEQAGIALEHKGDADHVLKVDEAQPPIRSAVLDEHQAQVIRSAAAATRAPAASRAFAAGRTSRAQYAPTVTRRALKLDLPRLTLFNGQQVYHTIRGQNSYLASYAIKDTKGGVQYESQLRTVESGVSLTVRGTVSADRRHVVLSIRPEVITISGQQRSLPSEQARADAKLAIEVPQRDRWQSAAIVSLLDGSTLLIEGGIIKGHLGLDDDKGTVDSKRHILMLIKPTIVVHTAKGTAEGDREP